MHMVPFTSNILHSQAHPAAPYHSILFYSHLRSPDSFVHLQGQQLPQPSERKLREVRGHVNLVPKAATGQTQGNE